MGDWLWFGHRWSYRPGVLCTGPQEHLLRSPGGLVVVNFFNFLSGKLESQRYMSAKVGKNSALRGGFSVVFDGPVEVDYVQNCSPNAVKCSK